MIAKTITMNVPMNDGLKTALVIFPYGWKDFEGWALDFDDRIIDIDAVDVGAILFASSLMYRTLRLCRVTRKDAKQRQLHAVYCSPRNVMEACNRAGEVMAARDITPRDEHVISESMLPYDKHWQAMKVMAG